MATLFGFHFGFTKTPATEFRQCARCPRCDGGFFHAWDQFAPPITSRADIGQVRICTDCGSNGGFAMSTGRRVYVHTWYKPWTWLTSILTWEWSVRDAESNFKGGGGGGGGSSKKPDTNKNETKPKEKLGILLEI